MSNDGLLKTFYIQLDRSKCHACWQCVDVCPEQLFKKIRLPLHKHVTLSAGACTGCLKCMKACNFNAITRKK